MQGRSISGVSRIWQIERPYPFPVSAAAGNAGIRSPSIER